MSDLVNSQLGDYKILKVLGAGGMGRVYQVRNTITDRIEAMKVLLPSLEGQQDVANRFQREIKVLAALNHPNIAALHTALTIDNQLVMIMEYVDGQSLSSRLSAGPLSALEALRYLEQVLGALSYAHRQHVVHRDIKPANMMITPGGTVKLMDFGIARSSEEPSKLTATGSTLGSLNYMSPEQINGKPADARSDLYSLGISLYEMVTGQRPFNGDSSFSIMAAHLTQAPKPPAEVHPGLPGIVNDLILTSIAKAPEQRFQNADAFRDAVRRAIQSLQDEKTLAIGSIENTVSGGFAAIPAMPTAAATAQKTVLPTAAAAVQAAVAPPAGAATAKATPLPAAVAGSHRGLYVGIGAFAVFVILVATAIYIPLHKKVSAAEAFFGKHTQGAVTSTSAPAQPAAQTQQAQPADSSSQNPASQTAAQQNSASQAENAQAATANPSSAPTASVPPKKLIAKNLNGAESATSSASASQAASAQKAADAAELDKLEHELDELSGRAAAVNSTLDTMQRQQAAAGYGLRGDIASKQAAMKINLAKAQDAVEHNDIARAKRYQELTTTDVEALEQFLGR